MDVAELSMLRALLCGAAAVIQWHLQGLLKQAELLADLPQVTLLPLCANVFSAPTSAPALYPGLHV